MRFRIFISNVQKEFAEERRRSRGAVATGEMFDLVGGIRIEAERDCCRGENMKFDNGNDMKSGCRVKFSRDR